jgi:hypothetical protein
LEYLGLQYKPKAEVHPGHKLTGPKEEEKEEGGGGEEELPNSLNLPTKCHYVFRSLLTIHSITTSILEMQKKCLFREAGN